MAVPEFLTVIEAGRVLRVGRTVAYAETKRYRDTNGAEGIPCVEIGGQVRVPTAKLEALAGRPIDEASIAPRPAKVTPRLAPPPPPTPTTTHSSRPSRTKRPDDQPRLFAS